jgi:hypothetical protein
MWFHHKPTSSEHATCQPWSQLQARSSAMMPNVVGLEDFELRTTILSLIVVIRMSGGITHVLWERLIVGLLAHFEKRLS